MFNHFLRNVKSTEENKDYYWGRSEGLKKSEVQKWENYIAYKDTIRPGKIFISAFKSHVWSWEPFVKPGRQYYDRHLTALKNNVSVNEQFYSEIVRFFLVVPFKILKWTGLALIAPIKFLTWSATKIKEHFEVVTAVRYDGTRVRGRRRDFEP